MSLVEHLLIGVRFIHFSAELFLFGGLLFPLYSRLNDKGLLKGLAYQLEIAAALAAMSALAWLGCVVVGMSGEVSALQDPDLIWQVLLESEFGRVWSVHFFLIMLLATTLVSLTAPPFSGPWVSWCVLLAAGLLVTQAMTGHAVSDDGLAGALHIVAHALHLFAAGVWLGGLLPLAAVLRLGPSAQLVPLLRRFSHVALPSVLLLAFSGMANAHWVGVNSVASLFGSPYAWLLDAKVLVFALLLGLAGLNRFRLLPRLAGAGAESALGGLRCVTRLEIVLLILVLALVSWLGTLPPPMAMG